MNRNHDHSEGSWLYIRKVRLDKEYRGQGLGLLFFNELLKRFGHEWRLCTLLPGPLREDDEGLTRVATHKMQTNVRTALCRKSKTSIQSQARLIMYGSILE